MAKLIVNAFYGNVHGVMGEEVDPILDINLDPFAGCERGAVPTFLLTPLTPLIRDGVEAKHGTVTGEQISRALSYYALLETLKTLSTICKSVDESIQVNIRKCGRLGNYSLRFLIGLPNVKVNFIDFPTGWAKKLKDLQPITEIISHVIRHPQSKNVESSNIVSFDFSDDDRDQSSDQLDAVETSYEDERQLPARKGKTKRPVVQQEDVTTSLAELMDATEELEVDEETVVENSEAVEEEATEVEATEVPVVEEEAKPVKKRASRSKAAKDVEVAEEEEAKPAKKRATRTKKATPASEEQLAQLSAKYSK